MSLDLAQWSLGWGLILLGFVSGALLGLGFASSDFLGGYDSFRRRLSRLGHISCVALGAGNIAIEQMFATGSTDDVWLGAGRVAAMIGAVAMPTVCGLSAWRESFRHWFFVPVISLIVAVFLMGWRGAP